MDTYKELIENGKQRYNVVKVRAMPDTFQLVDNSSCPVGKSGKCGECDNYIGYIDEKRDGIQLDKIYEAFCNTKRK